MTLGGGGGGGGVDFIVLNLHFRDYVWGLLNNSACVGF